MPAQPDQVSGGEEVLTGSSVGSQSGLRVQGLGHWKHLDWLRVIESRDETRAFMWTVLSRQIL